MTGLAMFVCGLVACGAAWYAGYRRGKREHAFTWHARGQREGLLAAYNTAKAALDAPSEGKPGRSIVGRAIVRRLRELAEGASDAS